MFQDAESSLAERFVTGVAICVLFCAIIFGFGPARAVLVGPGLTAVPDARTSMARTMAECEDSLTHSILKRTDASPEDARDAAALRCGVLVGSLPVAALQITPQAEDI